MDASRRLSEMIANYGDVIPRRDYEQLQKQYKVHLTLLNAKYICSKMLVSVDLIFSAQCVCYNESSRYCHDVRPSVCLGRACIVLCI